MFSMLRTGLPVLLGWRGVKRFENSMLLATTLPDDL
jgi:hypothetical protein